MPQEQNQNRSEEEIDPHADPNADVESDRSDKLMDTLFSSEEIRQPSPREEEEHEEEEEEQEEEEQEQEEEQEEESEEEESDIDYDADVRKKKEEEEERLDESAAQREARLKGREAKELRAQLTEKDLEISSLAEKLQEAQQRLEEIEVTRVRPEDNPEYVEIRSEIMDDARGVADLLPVGDPALLPSKFGHLMDDYLRMQSLTDGSERALARDALQGSIVDSLKMSEVPYAELDVEERKEFGNAVIDVMKLLQRNANKTRDMIKLHEKLTQRAKSGISTANVREYEKQLKELSPVLDSVGKLDEALVESNPHAIESQLARLTKESPEYAKRLDKAKRDVLDLVLGPKALTQSEIDQLEANGTDVKEFLKERHNAFRAKQKKLLPMLVQGLVVRPLIKEHSARLAELTDERESEESELDILRRTSRKKPKKSVDTDTSASAALRPDPGKTLGFSLED